MIGAETISSVRILWCKSLTLLKHYLPERKREEELSTATFYFTDQISQEEILIRLSALRSAAMKTISCKQPELVVATDGQLLAAHLTNSLQPQINADENFYKLFFYSFKHKPNYKTMISISPVLYSVDSIYSSYALSTSGH